METSLCLRHAERKFLTALDRSPAVLVHGPRQCGKTTLARMIGEARGHAYIDFNLPAARANARNDPDGFAASLRDRVVLDEVQYAPELFAALRVEIDRDRAPGRFLMTSSSNVPLLPKLGDTLAGRMALQRLHPLSQCELERVQPTFLDALFAADFRMRTTEPLLLQLAERVVAGGYPAMLARSSARSRNAWLRNHIHAVTRRDVISLRRIRSLHAVPKLLKLAAAQSARLLNVAGIASACGLTRPTTRDHLILLQQVFLLDCLPAWRHERAVKLVRRPKLHFGDTGLACALLGASAERLHAPQLDRTLFGQLLETFALQELRRQASASREAVDFFHYREKSGSKVDIVAARGRWLAGIDVKASGTVEPKDFRGLEQFRELASERFACGVVLYDGPYCLRFGERLYAVPVRYLWENADGPDDTPA